jgi:hypothetical protein
MKLKIYERTHQSNSGIAMALLIFATKFRCAMNKVAVAKGEQGTGPEIMDAVLTIFQAAGVPLRV